jgi:hypothetical protein
LIEGQVSFHRLPENPPDIVYKEYMEKMFISIVQTMNGLNNEHL